MSVTKYQQHQRDFEDYYDERFPTVSTFTLILLIIAFLCIAASLIAVIIISDGVVSKEYTFNQAFINIRGVGIGFTFILGWMLLFIRSLVRVMVENAYYNYKVMINTLSEKE